MTPRGEEAEKDAELRRRVCCPCCCCCWWWEGVLGPSAGEEVPECECECCEEDWYDAGPASGGACARKPMTPGGVVPRLRVRVRLR